MQPLKMAVVVPEIAPDTVNGRVKWSSGSGHRRAVVQPPLSQWLGISEIPESEEVLGGPGAPQAAPAPRLEAPRPLVHPARPGAWPLDSTCWNNGPFHSAPEPVHLWRYPARAPQGLFCLQSLTAGPTRHARPIRAPSNMESGWKATPRSTGPLRK